jgi:hypothetical protein
MGGDVIATLALALFGDHGVLSVFIGRWMLIDV